MRKLDGKVAIVTGAGGGLEKHIALRLAEEGASLMLADINETSLREAEQLK